MEGVQGYSKDDALKGYIAKSKDIMDILDGKDIKYTLEVKEGWGIIFVFNIGNKKLFTNNFVYGALDVYYYSDSYSCKAYGLIS